MEGGGRMVAVLGMQGEVEGLEGRGCKVGTGKGPYGTCLDGTNRGLAHHHPGITACHHPGITSRCQPGTTSCNSGGGG